MRESISLSALAMVCLGIPSETHCSPCFGDRSRKTLDKLLALLSPLNLRFYCTDNYAVYDSLPEEKRLTGKTFTQRIERKDLTHRTRIKRLNRKTIGYSKSEEMHDKVIGTFIEYKHYLEYPTQLFNTRLIILVMYTQLIIKRNYAV
ncbi:protein of unknown function [Xenorhabdus poinarii G6]|uniref:Insertion element iso-IS1n protein insB n=1 Tax=Xenorhabdus poinarii G6 TaxID=1354304 RepID=A0A068R3Y2_9GAMM|nr:protein of unknown function [Xenorhabdus poinarii G6]